MAATGPILWAGSTPVANEVNGYGWITSRKRAANSSLSISNPSSDHNEANRTADARDFATFNGAPLAHRIAAHYGIKGYSTGNYATYTVWRNGATFRLQILWAVQGHFNHVHLGVRLVAGNYQTGPTRTQLEAKALKPLGRRQRGASKTLLYRRRRRLEQARTGKGPKWRRWNRLVERSYQKVERLHRRTDGERKKVLGRVLEDRNGWIST